LKESRAAGLRKKAVQEDGWGPLMEIQE